MLRGSPHSLACTCKAAVQHTGGTSRCMVGAVGTACRHRLDGGGLFFACLQMCYETAALNGPGMRTKFKPQQMHCYNTQKTHNTSGRQFHFKVAPEQAWPSLERCATNHTFSRVHISCYIYAINDDNDASPDPPHVWNVLVGISKTNGRICTWYYPLGLSRRRS